MGQTARKAVGSRGGQVVSYTRAGHPVYASDHAKYGHALTHHDEHGGDPHGGAASVRAAFPHFSASDHLHASEAHASEAYSGRGARGPSHFLSQSHALASMSVRHMSHAQSPKKAMGQASTFFKAASLAFKADMQDADKADKETVARLGLQTKGELPPTYEPERDPNGTRQIPGGYWEGRAMCFDDGLSDFIIASAKAEKSFAKPSRAEHTKAPVLRRTRFVGQ